jgi:hypothetical protein
MNPTLMLTSTTLCIIYSLACLGLGVLLLRMLGLHLIVIKKIGRISSLSINFLLGAGSITIIWTILLSLSIFNVKIIIGILAIFLISSAVLGRQIVSGINKNFKNIWQDFINESLFWKIVIILTLFMVSFSGLVCLMPLHPLGDAAALYMVLPKLFAHSERFLSLGGYESAMSLGLHGELHFAALMSLGSDWMAKLFTWPVSVACALLLAGLARLAGVGRRGQWLVISMVFTSSAFTLLIGDGKVDIFGAAMGIATFCWIFLNEYVSDGLPQLVTGLFAGFAVVAKMSYAPSIITCIVLIILWHNLVIVGRGILDVDNLKKLSGKFFWLFLGMSLPIAVHLIKNWVLINEPFAPFFFLKGNPFAGSWTNQKWFSPKVIKKIILTYPLALTYGRYPMQYGTMSTMVLAFIPLVLLLPKPKRLTTSSMFQITIIGLLGVVIWKLIRPGIFAPRYILYSLMLLIPVAAGCAEYVSKNYKESRWLAGLIVATCIVSLCINITDIQNYNYNSQLVNYISGRSDDSAVIGPAYRAAEKLNNTAEIGERVLSMTYQTFWYRPDLLVSLSHGNRKDRKFLKTLNNISPEEVWNFFYAEGFRYVFLNEATHAYINKFLNLKQVPNWLEVQIIFEEKDYKIYRLSAKGGERIGEM